MKNFLIHCWGPAITLRDFRDQASNQNPYCRTAQSDANRPRLRRPFAGRLAPALPAGIAAVCFAAMLSSTAFAGSPDFAHGGPYFYVDQLGAYGDGTHDDAPAIQAALSNAVAYCNTSGPAYLCFTPGNNYFLETSNEITDASVCVHLCYEGAILSPLTLEALAPPPPSGPLSSGGGGPPGTATLSSATAGIDMLLFYGSASGITVSDLVFTNRHGTTTLYDVAIDFHGTNAQMMSNVTVSGCGFYCFSQALRFRGGWNCAVSGDGFYYPFGRDSGSTFDDANVSVVTYGNGPTSWNRQFYVRNNYFDGLSATNNGWPADGLIVGDADGMYCYENEIYNHGAEGIFFQKPLSPITDSSVYNNIIENIKTLPAGAVPYGIVTWISGTQVYDNTISNTGYGLVGYGTNAPISNLSFHNNTIYQSSTTTSFVYPLSVFNVANSSFYGNNCYLDLSVATTDPTGSFMFPFNAGIAAQGWYSSYSPGLLFTNNNFTIQANNSLVGCAGIGLDHVWLDANLDNFSNNSFYNWSGLTNVYAYGYPLYGANYPNTNSDSTIDTIIYPLNSW